MVINPIIGLYIPIIRIPIKGGMTIPNITTFDHGTYRGSVSKVLQVVGVILLYIYILFFFMVGLDYIIQKKSLHSKGPRKISYLQWLKNWGNSKMFPKACGWKNWWLKLSMARARSRPLKCFQKGWKPLQLNHVECNVVFRVWQLHFQIGGI